MAEAAVERPPSRAAHLALAAAARASLSHALPWPPAPDRVTELLADEEPAARARAQRRLSERAQVETHRVHQGLRDARRRLDEVCEEFEEDPRAGVASAVREAKAWTARHGLPQAWFQEEAARRGVDLELDPEPAASSRARLPREPEAGPEDAPYLAALKAVWGGDALWLGARAAEDRDGMDLEVLMARAPRPDELLDLESRLKTSISPELRVLGVRSCGSGRRRIRLSWKALVAPAPGPDRSASLPSRPAHGAPAHGAQVERTALLAELSAPELERHARREFLLRASPCGDPLFLRQLLDRRGRADLACWAGPYAGRTQVALVLGERALARGLSAGVLLRRTLRSLEGDGGGSPRWAEGACQAPPQAVLGTLRAWVEAGGLS